MPDQVFKNTPWGDITLTDSMPPWQRKMWLSVLGVPQTPPFIPEFEPQHVITNSKYGPQLLNRDYFATQATALELMTRLGASRIAQVPYQAQSSFDTTDAKEWWLVFPDGTAHNAGLLAVKYRINPEDMNPGVALRDCLAAVEVARSQGQKLPVTTEIPADVPV